MVLLHICDRDEWQAATGPAYRPRRFVADGFIHLSRADQVLRPADRLYRGRTDLVLLVVDEEGLADDLRWEPSTVPDEGGELFPHLYAELDRSSVRAVLPFPCEPDGSFRLPERVADLTD